MFGFDYAVEAAKARHDASEFVRQTLIAYRAARLLANADTFDLEDEVVSGLQKERAEALCAINDLKEALPLYDLPPLMIFVWNDEFHVLNTQTLEVAIAVGLYNL